MKLYTYNDHIKLTWVSYDINYIKKLYDFVIM